MPVSNPVRPTFTGQAVTGLTFSAGGLTGATAASRYAGATASGAPASGTFAVGDFVLDQTGNVWVCTVAGTPGTWVAAAPTYGTPGSSAVGDTVAAGSATTLARSDHRHGRESFGSTAGYLGGANAAGTATTPARSDHVHGPVLYSSFATAGDAQSQTVVLRCATTGTTGTRLTTDGNAAGAANSLPIANYQAIAFRATIVTQTQTTASGANVWEYVGLLARGANAAATALVSSTNTVAYVAGVTGATVALAADTTNGCLSVTATGVAATNLRWVCTLTTAEVTYP